MFWPKHGAGNCMRLNFEDRSKVWEWNEDLRYNMIKQCTYLRRWRHDCFSEIWDEPLFKLRYQFLARLFLVSNLSYVGAGQAMIASSDFLKKSSWSDKSDIWRGLDFRLLQRKCRQITTWDGLFYILVGLDQFCMSLLLTVSAGRYINIYQTNI